jgi:hypothetical protein
MKTIVNKDNEIIKKYLDARKELKEDFIKNFDYNFFTYDNPQDYLKSLLEQIDFHSEKDPLLYYYDDYITTTKLSNQAKNLLDLMIIVDYDYIAYDDNSYRPEVASFENANDRKNWLKNKSNHYYTLEINEIKGSLEDNDSLNDNYNDGDALFIKANSIYSDNIKIAILKY